MIKPFASQRSFGLTMVEVLVVVAICAILASIAVPSFRSWMTSQRVISTTGEILSDLRFARSEAVTSNSSVFVVFNNDAGNGCYTVFRSPDTGGSDESGLTQCDCAKGAGSACDGAVSFKELKTFALPAGADVSISGPLGEIYRSSQYFNSTDVAVNTGMKVRVIAAGGKELNIVTSPILPRPSVCSPAGSKIAGYKPCS
jgi:prepilin-type N-terminal cleavage/methylation domain-containing protein